MPYLGDSPTNPVPLTLVSGAAVGEASSPTEHDRHICWFSVPAQAAGHSIQLMTEIGGLPATEVDLVMIWEGGTTAYFVNVDRTGTRQATPYRPLPAGTPALIGVLPRGALWPVYSSLDGDAVPSAPARTLAQWATDFPTDLTKRLPADVSLTVGVAATVAQLGSAADPHVVNFTSSSTPVELVLPSTPNFQINVTLAANTALKITDDGVEGRPSVNDPAADGIPLDDFSVVLKPASGLTLTLTKHAGSSLPIGNLHLEPIPVSSVSGVGTDDDGSPEQVNVLLFRVNEAYRAVEGGPGGYSFANIPNGDYIAVAFSRADARDVRALNVLVPPGERSVGGGYVFVPPLPE